jgi:hypothetical protein
VAKPQGKRKSPSVPLCKRGIKGGFVQVDKKRVEALASTLFASGSVLAFDLFP